MAISPATISSASQSNDWYTRACADYHGQDEWAKDPDLASRDRAADKARVVAECGDSTLLWLLGKNKSLHKLSNIDEIVRLLWASRKGREGLAENHWMMEELYADALWLQLANDPAIAVRFKFAGNHRLASTLDSEKIVAVLLADSAPEVQQALAGNRSLPNLPSAWQLTIKLLELPHCWVALAANPTIAKLGVSVWVMRELAKSTDPMVHRALKANPVVLELGGYAKLVDDVA